MYSGGFYSFPSQEEFWAYWSRYIFINRYQNAPKSVHEVLLELVRDKDYYVITTNVDHCFQKAGFDKKRLFYTQGDYGLFQCSEPCCQETLPWCTNVIIFYTTFPSAAVGSEADALSRATGSSAFVAGCDSAIFLVVWLKKNGAV